MVLLKHRQFYMIEKDTIQPIKLLKKSVLIWQFATNKQQTYSLIETFSGETEVIKSEFGKRLTVLLPPS